MSMTVEVAILSAEISRHVQICRASSAEPSSWAEVTVGYVSYDIREIDKTLHLTLHSETDNKVTFEHTFSNNIPYNRIASVIYWSDPAEKVEESAEKQEEPPIISWSVNFASLEACNELYLLLSNLQIPVEITKVEEDEESTEVFLPFPSTTEILAEVDERLKTHSSSIVGKKKLAEIVLSEGFMDRLVDLFQMAEDLDDRPTLYKLNSIIIQIMMLNSIDIIKLVITTEYIMPVLGMFEYSSAYPDMKFEYRQYISSKDLFRQVISIENERLIEDIHMTFRAQYLKDVVLARLLDDDTFCTLSVLIRQMQHNIVEELTNDAGFLDKLLPLFADADSAVRMRLLDFLREFLGVAKMVVLGNANKFYQSVKICDLLSFIDSCFKEKTAEFHLKASEVLLHVMDHNIDIVRKTIIASAKTEYVLILPSLIDSFISETDVGIRWQFVSIIKILVERQSSAISEFLSEFYQNHVNRLLLPFTALQPKIQNAIHTNSLLPFHQSDLLFQLSELLISFINLHSFRIRYLIIGSSLISNVMTLLTYREMYLQAAAIRVLRAMIAENNPFVFRFIMKNHFLEQILKRFMALDDKDNLITAAILELFHYIRNANLILLIEYLQVNFHEMLIALGEKSFVFKALLPSRDASDEGDDTQSALVTSMDVDDTESKDKMCDRDEEYFSSSSSLVDDYETHPDDKKMHNDSDDNDNDENKDVRIDADYNPPPRRQKSDEDDDEALPFLSSFTQKAAKAKVKISPLKKLRL